MEIVQKILEMYVVCCVSAVMAMGTVYAYHELTDEFFMTCIDEIVDMNTMMLISSLTFGLTFLYLISI